jgi:exocyst complex component 7
MAKENVPHIFRFKTRDRLTKALQNRDLLKSIGEYEEHQPVEARPIREMRSVFECLGGEGYHLGPARKREPASLTASFGVAASKVVRTEKVGSGGYTNLVKKTLKTGYPHIDAYGESRKEVAFKSIDGYYRRIKNDRKKSTEARKSFDGGGDEDEADVAARDAVKCLEHAMVVVAGEKSVYRATVGSSLVQSTDADATQISPIYRKACVAAYAHVVAAVVDRTMDIIETVFLKEGHIGQSSGEKNDKDGNAALTVRNAASAAAAGLRMLDGVRMLGPSLAKLCDMAIEDETDPATPKQASQNNMTVASTLCIAIHRTTVKNTAKTLENLAKAIQEDPVNGVKHRPPDARIASVSSDVVRALRLISPFVSAYKSVTKRRALPWDPNIGDDAGEMESYVRFLIMRLLNSLQGKALNYTKGNEEDEGGQAKANMFMINNTFYLLQQLAPKVTEATAAKKKSDDGERYQLDREWFEDKVKAIFESEKGKYLAHWENINSHLTSVDSAGLEYQKNKNLLSLESGRLFKDRFKGFNDDFELLYLHHNGLAVIDTGLRRELQSDVKKVFLNRYEKFYDKYSRFRFSKKNQNEYLKFPPEKVDSMLDTMYRGQGFVGDDDEGDDDDNNNDE